MDGFQGYESTRAISEISTHPSTRDAWILSMRASLALIGQALDEGPETLQICGLTHSESSMRFGPRLSFSRMSPASQQSTPLFDQIWRDSDIPYRVPSSPQLPGWVLLSLGPDTGPLPAPTAKANQWAASMRKWATCRRLQHVFPFGAHPRIWEWMMAWPLGWTALRRPETAKCRSKPRSRGGF